MDRRGFTALVTVGLAAAVGWADSPGARDLPWAHRARRGFTALMTVGLLESLWSRDLLAASGRAALGPWFRELTEMTRALRGARVRDLEFQAQMEDLFRRV